MGLSSQFNSSQSNLSVTFKVSANDSTNLLTAIP